MAKPILSLFSHGCEQRSLWVKAALTMGVSSAQDGGEQRSGWVKATLSMGVSNALHGGEQRSLWVRATLPMGVSGAQDAGERRSGWVGATLRMGGSNAPHGGSPPQRTRFGTANDGVGPLLPAIRQERAPSRRRQPPQQVQTSIPRLPATRQAPPGRSCNKELGAS
jgi:hypothetical protein